MRMRKTLIAAVVIAPALLMGYLSAAHAHGEKAQESFLRMQTVAFFDTEYSTDKVKQGEGLIASRVMVGLGTVQNHNNQQPNTSPIRFSVITSENP